MTHAVSSTWESVPKNQMRTDGNKADLALHNELSADCRFIVDVQTVRSPGRVYKM